MTKKTKASPQSEAPLNHITKLQYFHELTATKKIPAEWVNKQKFPVQQWRWIIGWSMLMDKNFFA